MAVYGASRLAYVEKDLVRLITDVGTYRDVWVIQGARSVADEQADIDKGVSHLKDPTHSLHVIVPGVRPLARAVDLVTWHPTGPDWNNKAEFLELAGLVKLRANALGIQISWGGDWPHPFDFDHYQLGPDPA